MNAVLALAKAGRDAEAVRAAETVPMAINPASVRLFNAALDAGCTQLVLLIHRRIRDRIDNHAGIISLNLVWESRAIRKGHLQLVVDVYEALAADPLGARACEHICYHAVRHSPELLAAIWPVAQQHYFIYRELAKYGTAAQLELHGADVDRITIGRFTPTTVATYVAARRELIAEELAARVLGTYITAGEAATIMAQPWFARAAPVPRRLIIIRSPTVMRLCLAICDYTPEDLAHLIREYPKYARLVEARLAEIN